MPQQPSSPTPAVTGWLIIVGSVAIVLHLTAVAFRALAAPSGPWPSMEGMSMATPPQFAFSVDQVSDRYLKAIKMTHNYHFPTNQPGMPGIYVEVRLKDEQGQDVKTFKIPEEEVNFWVRHRQELLAQRLGNDAMVMAPQAESIPAPGRQVPEVTIWNNTNPHKLTLEKRPENLLPRDRPVARPTDWQLLVARSYARYLCRIHGGAKAEVIRHHKNPYPPAVLGLDNVQEGFFEEVTSNFGELPR